MHGATTKKLKAIQTTPNLKPNLNNTGKNTNKTITSQFLQNTSQNYRTRDRGLNMGSRKPQMNHKHRHLNQKGENCTNIKQTANQLHFPITKLPTQSCTHSTLPSFCHRLTLSNLISMTVHGTMNELQLITD